MPVKSDFSKPYKILKKFNQNYILLRSKIVIIFGKSELVFSLIMR